MKRYSSLQDIWQEYFIHTPQIQGGDGWSIVFIAQDNGGALISLANPFSEKFQDILVEKIAPNDMALFVEHYKSRFMDNLDKRFGFFRPEVDSVLTEYPDWQTFYDTWLNNDAQLVQGNMPLLFDYPSPDEYRAMQLKGADHAGYRRLLVVVYQYRKQLFQHIFVKQVDDHMYETIQKEIKKLFSTALPDLINKQSSTPS